MHKLLKLLFILLLACSAFLTGCGSTVPVVKPFKMDIQQGNVVTSKMLLQLKPGMTKSQVKFIMGSPLLLDSFHTNRWDYFYQMRQAGKIKEQRRVILDFENELLARVRGDVVPEGTAGAAAGAESSVVTLPKSVEAKPKKEEGFFDKLKFWESDEKKPEAKSAVKEVAPGVEPKVEAPTGDTPSVLAVPVPIGGAPSLPAPSLPETSPPAVATPEPVAPAIAEPMLEAPKVGLPKVEAPPVEPVKIEPLKVEPATVEPPIAAPIVMPAKPAAMRPATSGEPFSFRMDRNLDAKNLEATVKAAPVSNAQKADVAPPPPAKEPSYFEKMLEKIGF